MKHFTPKNLKTIVWDVDDVLNELMRNWYESFWRSENPSCKISFDSISENPPHELLGISKQTYLDSLDRFRKSDQAANMRPVSVLREWFELNGPYFYHIALTATPLQTASKTAEWVFRHFGAWIRSINFVPSPREGENIPAFHESKADFLAWWKQADIFVDDNPVNLAEAEALGIHTLCIPQPWNDNKLTLSETLAQLSALR